MASPAGLTERAPTFGQAEVVKEVAGALPEGGTGIQIEHLAAMFLDSKGRGGARAGAQTPRGPRKPEASVGAADDRPGEPPQKKRMGGR